jgi:hypothetical protein
MSVMAPNTSAAVYTHMLMPSIWMMKRPNHANTTRRRVLSFPFLNRPDIFWAPARRSKGMASRMASICSTMNGSSGLRSKTVHRTSRASSSRPRAASQRGEPGRPKTRKLTPMAKTSWMAIGACHAIDPDRNWKPKSIQY